MRRWSIVIATLLLLAGLPRGPRDEAPRRSSLRVRVSGHADLEWMQRREFDLASIHVGASGEGIVEVLATPREAREIKARGLEIVRADRRARDDRGGSPAALSAGSGLPPGFGQGSLGGYYTLAEIDALLDHYAATYPAIVAPKVVIGYSVEGRPIHALKVSDNPTTSESEPRVLIDALHHAREPASMQTLVLLLHRLVTNYGNDPEWTGLVDTREIYFVPCVNPDGYRYNETIAPQGGGMWRKNRRAFGSGCAGVDLNRNYPTQFGIDDVGSSPNPCAESFRGPSALSEPESAALAAFAAQQQFTLAASLHAHGRQMMYPFGHQLLAPPDVGVYEIHGEELADDTGYAFGAVSDLVGLANGNFVDHLHGAHGVEAWSFEIGTTFWPPVAEMIANAESNSAALLRLIAFAGAELAIESAAAIDLTGDLDGFADPGETIELRLPITNVGRAGLTGVTASLTSFDPAVSVIQAGAIGGALGAQATTTLGAGQFRLALAPTLAPGTRVAVGVTLAFEGRSCERTVEFDVGTRRRIGRDDAEADLGWSLGLATDTATSGRWTRGDPVGVVQGLEWVTPEDDATPGAGKRCFVTAIGGTAAGQDDVDDGFTTLLSPVFDLSAAVAPRIELARFFWCSKADQPLTIEISNDGGQSHQLLAAIGGRPNSWRRSEWTIPAHVALTSRMRLRITARDPENTGVVEAAIDDLQLFDYGVAPHALVMGRPRVGGTVGLALAGPPAMPLALFVAPAPAQLVVPGLSGPFRLDPTTAVLLFVAPTPATGASQTNYVLPADPALAGASVWLQPIGIGSPALAGNSTQITIEPN